MSNPVTKPCFIAGTPRFSGAVADGAVNTTDGGGVAYSAISGLSAAVLIQSGPGRLNTVTTLNQLISGQSTIFYDSAVATSGGPFPTSGHIILAVLPPVWVVGASGAVSPQAVPGAIARPQAPFFSGLCAAPLASGAYGFGVTYTPQVVNSGGTP